MFYILLHIFNIRIENAKYFHCIFVTNAAIIHSMKYYSYHEKRYYESKNTSNVKFRFGPRTAPILERFQTNSFDNFLFTFHENSSKLNIRSCHYASFLDIKRQQEFCSHFIPLDVMNHVFNAKCDTFEIHPLKYCNV